ncbi:hypothetical protein EB118_13335 [bacterium]|nr:hypothetical protein [Actinomycetota bacterium]NDG31035.1 hypothetical protein [bacterium]
METLKLDTYSIVLLSFAGVSVVVLLVLLFVDPISFFVVALLLAILGFILFYFGFIQLDKTTKELDVLYTTAPTPEGVISETSALPSSDLQPRQLTGPEVFHVADNIFTYEEARAVCKAYDSELASYSQVEQAYNSGAEWCGYGWSEGGIALFPTQESTWNKLQKEQDPEKRMECGRPGINGGYFDPSTKFGVNCYGVKPNKKTTQKTPEDSAMNRLIGQIKDRLDKLFVSPFNDHVWSQPRIVSTETNVDFAGKIREGTKKTTQNVLEGVTNSFTDLISGFKV